MYVDNLSTRFSQSNQQQQVPIPVMQYLPHPSMQAGTGMIPMMYPHPSMMSHAAYGGMPMFGGGMPMIISMKLNASLSVWYRIGSTVTAPENDDHTNQD